jgi:hypothetical protein
MKDGIDHFSCFLFALTDGLVFVFGAASGHSQRNKDNNTIASKI